MGFQKYGRTLAYTLAAALVLTLLAWTGLLDSLDLAAADALYQQPAASDGEIVLIGIDQRALDEIGPYQEWGRDIMAMALEALNEKEAYRPAAIAIDVLYAGETDPGADAWLAEAAGAHGNVITACAAEFRQTFVETEDGHFENRRFAVLGFEEPYGLLKEQTRQGHVNAMLDTDGILRHHLLSLALPDGTEVPSLALAAVQQYRAFWGQAPSPLPPTREGFWYVPFTGKPGHYASSISIADLVAGEVPYDMLGGKIVLIGPYAVGLQDSYFTAADHTRQMYGIEFQANAIEALLRGDFKQEIRRSWQLAFLFAVLAAAFPVFWKKRLWISTIVWAVLCAAWLALCLLAYRWGIVLRVLWIPVGLTVLFVGSIAINYIRSVLEKRRVTRTFKRYVAPEIVNELLREHSDSLGLGGKLTHIAVLFVDVRGFTTMSERLQPRQVVQILNRYLTLISDCILNNGGTLDKFVGDAAMAFWGAPLPQEDYVMHAVKAAADMVSGSRALSEELLAQFGQTVSFGIGIHVGDAVVGNIGSPQRMDYTAIGDTVNTAARLEANAPSGTIYISRAVADQLKGRIRTTSLGTSIKLKGKAEGFEILTMDGILPS